MLRYIIGITLITIGIIIVRALSNGKVLKKHQYAFWIIIPLYMILSPFIRFDDPLPGMISSMNVLFPAKVESVTNDLPDNETPSPLVENATAETAGNISQDTYLESNYDYKLETEDERITEQYVAVSGSKANNNRKTETILSYISYSVSSVLIIALITYNIGFISYCRRKRELIGKDPSSRLRIYNIKNSRAPFLLFNKIYVNKDSGDINEFVISHEACHYKHGDHIWVLIRYLVLFINWYNPIIWAAFILSGHDCELACDEEVLHVCGTESSAGYVDTLLGLLRHRSEMPFAFSVSTGMRDGYEMMKKRILNIKSPANKNRKVLALSMAAILLFTSCSFVDTSKNVRKIKADDPWFDTNIVEVKTGADEGRLVNHIYHEFIGSDEQYYILYTGGHYETTEEEENADNFAYNDYNFYYIAVVDRNTKQTITTIDLRKDLSTYEYPDNTYYSNGIITVQSDGKVRDYNPLTGELVDTRKGRSLGIGAIPSLYRVGEYEVEVLRNFPDTGRSYCDLVIKAPDGKTSELEIKDIDKNVSVQAVLQLSNTKAVLPATIAGKKVYYELDLSTAQLTIGNEKEYEWLDNAYLLKAITGNDGLVYYSTGYGIYRLDAVNKESKEVFEFNWCDLNIGFMESFDLVECSENYFLLFGTYDETNVYDGKKADKANIVEITKAKTNPHAGKTILELYDLKGVDKYTGEAIQIFNQTNGKYYIEITDRYRYSDFYDITYDDNNDDVAEISTITSRAKLSSKLAIDIMNGEGPDILMNVSSFSQLNNSNCLADLSPYVKDYDSENYFSNIIEGSRTEGALYQLPISFGVEGILTKTKNVSNTAKGFTFEEYTKFVDEVTNGKDPIIYGQAVYFTLLFSGMSEKFISNGKVDLSGSEFKELADYVKDNVREEGISWNAWYQSTQADGPIPKAMLTFGPCAGIGDFYCQGMSVAQGGKGVSLLGLPSVDGRGPRFTPTCSVAISSHSVDKKACGEFVKILLSDDIQNRIALNDRFVLSRNAFFNAGEIAIDYFNNGGSTSGGNGVRSDFTTKDIDYVENMILGCSTINSEDSDISIILIEEMPPYFLGQKDLDEVIKIAEDRIQTVLNERG